MELSERLGQQLDLSGFLLEHEEEDGPDRSVMGRLVALLSELTGSAPESITAERTLDDVGVSSLDRIELAVRAEDEFGVRAEAVVPVDDPGALSVGEIAERLTEMDDS
ncbi:acyl carrier protein [Corynebacterium mayonis]|uniref:acyl carrier protein n=1 Tax=Corynebacterium mayonis TaxID=3062461 RepID=UPI0031403132